MVRIHEFQCVILANMLSAVRAIAIGISWIFHAFAYTYYTYRRHKNHEQSEEFLLMSGAFAVMYVHMLAWSQGFSLQASVVLVPPCVSFAIWMGSLWVDCQVLQLAT